MTKQIKPEQSNIWIDGIKLMYKDRHGKLWNWIGEPITTSGKPGKVWIEENFIIYTDCNGQSRSIYLEVSNRLEHETYGDHLDGHGDWSNHGDISATYKLSSTDPNKSVEILDYLEKSLA